MALTDAAQTFRAWWQEADHVLIGAGAGLSAAAGIDYSDEADFARVFPVLHEQGFKARYQLIGFQGFTPSQHWAYWATHVNDIRFKPRPPGPYGQLRALLEKKDVFVLTSNVDAMFVRSGFDAERVYTPQGDYAAMQCRTPCRKQVWPSEPDVKRALEHIDPDAFEIVDVAAIPRCPNCGGEVFLNVRLDGGFVEQPYQAQAERLRAWLAATARGRLLMVDIGSGFNTPTVVRWQLERLTLAVPGSKLVRINRDDADTGKAPRARALAIQADAGAAIDALVAACTPTAG